MQMSVSGNEQLRGLSLRHLHQWWCACLFACSATYFINNFPSDTWQLLFTALFEADTQMRRLFRQAYLLLRFLTVFYQIGQFVSGLRHAALHPFDHPAVDCIADGGLQISHRVRVCFGYLHPVQNGILNDILQTCMIKPADFLWWRGLHLFYQPAETL